MTLTSSAHRFINTDFYQITMAAGYAAYQPDTVASFELYVRRLPAHRHFLVAAGLEQALDYLENARFLPEDIEALKKHPALRHLPEHFFEQLTHFRFTGDVHALPEGTVFFAYTPLLRITAPLMEAQIVETYLLALLNYQTGVASKAARIQNALKKSRGVDFIDFGSRRAHGPEAAIHAARAAFIGGAAATANVAAGLALDIPITGTAAHAWTMAFEEESTAFENYHRLYPHHTTLLVDTYDTLQGVDRAIAAAGQQLKGIRLDSGDFLSLSIRARQKLDAAGLHHTRIIVSGDMNEEKIDALLTAGAPIDGFGVGTELTTCRDAPSLGGVYKLVETIDATGKKRYGIKASASKISYPGQKQVWRTTHNGKFAGDVVHLATHLPPHSISDTTPLLQCVMKNGRRQQASRSLREIQAFARDQLEALPTFLQELHPEHAYPCDIGKDVQELYEAQNKNTVKVGQL